MITLVERLIAALARLNTPLCALARNLAATLIAVMTAIVLLQIVFRYALNNSLSWTEELAKTMMVWATMLVAPWAYRMGANVSIDLFVEALPGKLRAVLGLLINLLVIWIAAVFFAESLALWQRGVDMRSATLPASMAIFYSVLPFGFGGMVLVGVELTLRQVAALLNPARTYAVTVGRAPIADA